MLVVSIIDKNRNTFTSKLLNHGTLVHNWLLKVLEDLPQFRANPHWRIILDGPNIIKRKDPITPDFTVLKTNRSTCRGCPINPYTSVLNTSP